MHGRLADILLCLSQPIFREYEFNLSLTRSYLAELTGMSTESVVRVMKDFKNDGLIGTEGKDIKIVIWVNLISESELQYPFDFSSILPIYQYLFHQNDMDIKLLVLTIWPHQLPFRESLYRANSLVGTQYQCH